MIKILWLGDSTQAGWVPPIGGSAGYFTENTESAVATRLLNERFGDGRAVSENIAIGGTTLKQWLNGNAALGMAPLATLLASSSANIVVMQATINVAYTAGFQSTAALVSDYVADVQAVRNIILAAGKTPIFATANPINMYHNGILWELTQGLRTCATQMGMQLIDHYDAIARHVNNWQQFLPDGTHPDETLYHFKGSLSATGLARHVG